MNFLAYFLAAVFVCVTLPIWGGAVVALVTGGFYLLFSNPWLLLAIFVAPFILRCFV